MGITITAPRVLTGTADFAPGWIQIDGPRVVAVGGGAPPSRPDVELTTGVLTPGLVDAQINGAFGVDFADATEEQWAHVSTALAATGVTTYVPTFITAPVSEIADALRRFAAVRPKVEALAGAAQPVGAHVEGPFISERRRGAHRLEMLTDPTAELLDDLIEAGRDGVLCYLTLAPERAGALDAVTRLVDAGVRVSVGHSDATEAVTHAAADRGATLVTHLYNAQRPLHHRDPGVTGAALVDERLTAGIIVDGHHVEAAAVRVAFACKPGKVMLVTDAVAALGMPEGTYVLGGQDFVVSKGEVPRRNDGTIAGAACRLDDAIALTVAAGVPLRTAVEAATRVPADAIGRPDLGRLARGAQADLVWLAPDGEHPLRARAVWIGGTLAHGEATNR